MWGLTTSRSKLCWHAEYFELRSSFRSNVSPWPFLTLEPLKAFVYKKKKIDLKTKSCSTEFFSISGRKNKYNRGRDKLWHPPVTTGLTSCPICLQWAPIMNKPASRQGIHINPTWLPIFHRIKVEQFFSWIFGLIFLFLNISVSHKTFWGVRGLRQDLDMYPSLSLNSWSFSYTLSQTFGEKQEARKKTIVKSGQWDNYKVSWKPKCDSSPILFYRLFCMLFHLKKWNVISHLIMWAYIL